MKALHADQNHAQRVRGQIQRCDCGSVRRKARGPAREGLRIAREGAHEGRKEESGKNYSMPDKPHARNAKARAARLKDGNLCKDEKERIDRKADKKLDD